MKDKLGLGIITVVLGITAYGVYLNVKEQQSVDRSKIPAKVELNRSFQRWITNIKNKGLDLEADDFRLQEEVEIYNTKWMRVYSLDEEGKKEEFEAKLSSVKNLKKVIFSPSEREFIDYREEVRDGYNPNEVHFYGQKEDKIIDARILDCSTRANCYFDRAYFLDNDVFVISEFSRNIDKKDTSTQICDINSTCSYTVKVHVIDLVNNSRLVYESKPFEMVFAEFKPEL